MGYWPLRAETDATGTRLSGFEDSCGIEIRHCFFEAYHACGVQDAAGKAARYPLIQQIGFGNVSVYNYHECYQWSISNQSAPAHRTRDGLFAATGSYLWYALSDGLDAYKETYQVIDLRSKNYRPVTGSSQCWVFWSRDFDGKNKPRVLARRFWCACVNCRSGSPCVLVDVIGNWCAHDVSIKATLSLDDSRTKKASEKAKRLQQRQAKAAMLVAATGAAGGGGAAGAEREGGHHDGEVDVAHLVAEAEYEGSESETDEDDGDDA
jgi:hypothetical protein